MAANSTGFLFRGLCELHLNFRLVYCPLTFYYDVVRAQRICGATRSASGVSLSNFWYRCSNMVDDPLSTGITGLSGRPSAPGMIGLSTSAPTFVRTESSCHFQRTRQETICECCLAITTSPGSRCPGVPASRVLSEGQNLSEKDVLEAARREQSDMSQLLVHLIGERPPGNCGNQSIQVLLFHFGELLRFALW
ncbi:hypothetical protein L209DRAFT_754573 [Thermothelomyces heterothallicus CBS 203.75]